MHPDVQELQVKLKEILYDCATEVKATKAALYLRDGGTNRFELVTEYGFRGSARPSADEKNPVVDKCEKTHAAFFVNGLTVEPRFSELLFEAQTDRLLAAPIYIRGQLVGIVDMRDKGGKVPFETSDLPKAQSVADRIAQLFALKNVWGQRFITLSDHTRVPAVASAPPPTSRTPTPLPNSIPVPAVTPPPPAPAPAPPAPAPPPQQATSYQPKIASLVLEARTAADRILNFSPTETLSETELNIVREIMRAVLQIPGAIVAVFSALGPVGTQDVVARSMIGDDAISLIQTKFNSWLTKRGESAANLRNRVQTPFGTTGPQIREQDVKKVFTAPIVAGNVRNLYLSVAFATDPERSVHELLAAFHQQLQMAIEQSLGRRQALATRLRIAEKVVEPDFNRYPELRRHSNAVVARVDAFTRFLSMTQGEIDTARIVALVHDAGMRLLDYDRLYRKRDLSPDDLNILREHATVGAAVVDPLLGPEIAKAVLCHHERWDGRGYPNGLSGEEIPLMSSIVQVCDAYESMTAVDNYQTPQSHDAAMSVIVRAGGTQFDPDLARRFEEFMRSAPHA
ncbi:MAG TPA: HD domain-containing phosphohydrolase [Thermoanaerobaculia bacterium]